MLTLIYKLTGNRFSQKVIRKIAISCLKMLGIGTGGDPSTSGEEAVLKHLYKLQSEPIIFDVGANKGQYLNQIKKIFAANKVSVHCFEPSKKAFAILVHENQPNLLHQFQFNPVALGSSEQEKLGNSYLHFSQEGEVGASLSNRRMDHFGKKWTQKEEIYIQTLEKYCSTHSIHKIDLLKIDVEGHELDVLEGAKELLKHRQISMITFEFGGPNIDSRTFFQDLWYFLDAYGYSIYRITPSGYFFPIPAYNEFNEQYKCSNYVAIAKK